MSVQNVFFQASYSFHLSHIFFPKQFEFPITISIKVLLLFTFISLMIIDFKKFLLPNRLLFIATILSLVLNWGDGLLYFLYSGLSAFLFGMLIYYAGYRYYKKEVFGMGDVKLFGIVGFYTGFQNFIFIITLASALALIFTYFVFHHLKVPYGAYISLVTIVFILIGLFNVT